MLKKSALKLFKDYYQELDDDANVRQFKLLFNYFIKPQYKEKIIDELVAKFWNDEEIYNNLYLTKKDIQIMNDCNMLIASHSANHLTFKNSTINEQKWELKNSIRSLNSIIKEQKIQIFSYPYGESTPYAKRWLKNNNFDFAFSSIPSKNVDYKDLIHKRFELYRYDCNEFKYGKASYG